MEKTITKSKKRHLEELSDGKHEIKKHCFKIELQNEKKEPSKGAEKHKIKIPLKSIMMPNHNKTKKTSVEKKKIKTDERNIIKYRNKSEEILDDKTYFPVEYDCRFAVNEFDNVTRTEAELLALAENEPIKLTEQFISLLSQGCTLPFIARYRKAAVNNLKPDRLQDLFESYQNVLLLKKKAKSVIETLKKSNKITPELYKSISSATSIAEIDLLYAPLKTHKASLAERARSLGLEQHARELLNGHHINISSLCTKEEELSSIDKVESHITHIIADIIYRDPRVLEHMRSLKAETRFKIQCSQTRSSMKEKESDVKKKKDSKSDPETYKLYFDWKCQSHFVKPYQTLALNRGEDEKILAVKVTTPDWFYHKLERFCMTLWKSPTWVSKGLNDAYNRLIKPWLSRQVRSDLTILAQKEAVKTFTANLEKYLLTEPIKNKRIAGLDPGFRGGCKVGVINADGEQLETCVIHPNLSKEDPNDSAAQQLRNVLLKHRVDVIGLGNGTACRETERWLKWHSISDNFNVVIVPEQGASIYSISKEAQKEHPNLDPNLISALSLARRVLDPMGELMKVDPKNLGVGLYQHDIPPKMLESALNASVENIVSLVGVDLNTASQALLRRISGLNDSRAKKIIEYRQENGAFVSREDLLKVSGIGKVTYQQCAGFLRVMGGVEPLDRTIIHPESYALAKLLAKKLKLNIKDLATTNFSESVDRRMAAVNIDEIAKENNADVFTLELILNAFRKNTYTDNMVSFCKPVFSVAVQTKDELKEGMTVNGVVRNVVPFGCFVDCGVGESGLVHRSNYGSHNTPKLGDRVSVTVIASTRPKKIQLRLEAILD